MELFAIFNKIGISSTMGVKGRVCCSLMVVLGFIMLSLSFLQMSDKCSLQRFKKSYVVPFPQVDSVNDGRPQQQIPLMEETSKTTKFNSSTIGNDSIDCGPFGFLGKIIPPEHQYQVHKGSTNERDRRSCRSRYEQHCFWNAGDYSPSLEFQKALRNYEAQHRRCINGHNMTAIFLQEEEMPEGCQYVLWKEWDGTGNQLISLVSAFVYALLTNRTLLITRDANLHKLMCEPFPGTSWLVPTDFPKIEEKHKTDRSGVFYKSITGTTKGNGSIEAKDGVEGEIIKLPHYLQIRIYHYQTKDDLRFFCPTEDKIHSHIPWIIFWSNNYSAPGLYLLPHFKKVLNLLFPDRALFLHVARYLFSPTNDIWSRITRIYDSYLASAEQRIGMQVRYWTRRYEPQLSTHLLMCAIESGVLPNLVKDEGVVSSMNIMDEVAPRKLMFNQQDGKDMHIHHNMTITNNQQTNFSRPIVVLLTSLHREYVDTLLESYIQYPNVLNKRIMVISPSHEGKQKTGHLHHMKKVIADMWLLSFMDEILSSPKSTFGYIGHGLAGITPIVFRDWDPKNHKLPKNNFCGRTNMPGPCFIDNPENMDCPLDPPSVKIGDLNFEVPELRHCLYQWGIGVNELDKP
jgi:xyloglucan fucosyltransferase